MSREYSVYIGSKYYPLMREVLTFGTTWVNLEDFSVKLSMQRKLRPHKLKLRNSGGKHEMAAIRSWWTEGRSGA